MYNIPSMSFPTSKPHSCCVSHWHSSLCFSAGLVLTTHSNRMKVSVMQSVLKRLFNKCTLEQENKARLMAVFWDSAPGRCCVQLCPDLYEVLSSFFETTWWWVVLTCGSVGMRKATGVNTWEVSEKTTCYLNSTQLLPHPLQPFISWSVLTNAAHPVCPYT